MKLGLQIAPPEKESLTDWLKDIVLRLRMMVDNGHLGFGDGTSTDNIFGTFVTYVSNAAPNTEDTITHNLGFVPIGYLVMSLDKGAVIYKGTTAWTTSLMYLKSNTATTTALLFILGPSNQNF